MPGSQVLQLVAVEQSGSKFLVALELLGCVESFITRSEHLTCRDCWDLGQHCTRLQQFATDKVQDLSSKLLGSFKSPNVACPIP